MCRALCQENIKRLAKSVWKNAGCRDLGQIFAHNWNRMGDERLAKLLLPQGGREYHPEESFLSAFRRLKERSDIDRMFKFDLQHYLQALLTSEDRLSMAFSVESRVPLLDHRIAELAGKLGSLKLQPGCSKAVLRRAVRGIVPAEILARRDKRGFPTPIGEWLRDPSLRLLDTFVFNGNTFAREYFDLKELRKLSQARTYFSTDWSERLWRVLNVCVWGQVFRLS
jgi:asparagine synthase (glutamine-hydrolysing)